MASNALQGDADKSSRYIIEFILFGMYLTFGLSWISTVPMSTEINQFLGVDKLQGARIFTIISAAKSVFPILAGILAAKIGLRNALKISAILIMAGLVVPFLPNYYMWIVTRFAFGVGGAMWVTLMGATAMQIFPPHQRPIVNALNGIAVNAGFALSLRYTLKIQESLGWQNTMTLYSIISAVFAVMLFVFGSSIPSETSNSSSSEESYLKTLKMPLTWIISVAFTGPLAIYLVFNGLLPIYYQEVFNIPKLQTMQWISLINLWGIPSSIATGFLLQKFGKCKPFILAASILLPAVSLSSVLISNTSIMSIMLPLTGIGMFLSVSPLITLTQNQKGMTPKLMGMVLGTMFSVTYIVSSAIPEIIGFFNRSGVPLGTLLSIACILTISPAISLLLPEKEKEV